MLGARLLPMQPTQHSKPPAIRVGGAPTRPSMGPVNSPVDTQGKRSPFHVSYREHPVPTLSEYRIYYDLRQPIDHALFTHLHHANPEPCPVYPPAPNPEPCPVYPPASNPEPCAVYPPAPNYRPMHKDWTRAARRP